MSFLAGRLAGKEAAYFFQESKQAVGKLVQKNPNASKSLEAVPSSSAAEHEGQHHADVLPEVLRHSLPSKVFRDDTVLNSSSSSFNPAKWVLPSQSKAVSSVSPDALNPLRAYLSLPQVTFGPRRWELPEMSHSVSASTANELHRDRHTTPINPEKIKAAAEGLANDTGRDNSSQLRQKKMESWNSISEATRRKCLLFSNIGCLIHCIK
ncbi:uncharacterized protein LOC114760944 isoform X3 [Neltuma alba]|uniref:uncharacterized protein LOC114760944 isoform X3 n=1 Tax=Neltuma alba TaxID=207710 RepID=UPI0010A353F0|nr:uncharacterized protein LOC114760944 isoform X3 [Prosopis alba]